MLDDLAFCVLIFPELKKLNRKIIRKEHEGEKVQHSGVSERMSWVNEEGRVWNWKVMAAQSVEGL